MNNHVDLVYFSSVKNFLKFFFINSILKLLIDLKRNNNNKNNTKNHCKKSIDESLGHETHAKILVVEIIDE